MYVYIYIHTHTHTHTKHTHKYVCRMYLVTLTHKKKTKACWTYLYGSWSHTQTNVINTCKRHKYARAYMGWGLRRRRL